MTEHEEILGQASTWDDAGLGVALATVVSTWGSAPRPAGSHLAVNERERVRRVGLGRLRGAGGDQGGAGASSATGRPGCSSSA